MIRILALGTLKAGFPLHDALRGARFLGRFRTVEPFPMFVAGPWYAPMILDEPGTGLQIRGELYEIDDDVLAKLDALESVGKPGNFRRIVQVEPMSGGSALPAFVYIKARELAVPAHTGCLDDYQDRRFVPFGARKEG